MSNRLYLSDRGWKALYEAQNGMCARAGCTSAGPFHADHSTPHALAGGLPDQLLCVPCHKDKTRTDVREIARAKRLSGETGSQAQRRAERKAQGKSPLLRGPGFPSKKKRARSADEILGAR